MERKSIGVALFAIAAAAAACGSESSEFNDPNNLNGGNQVPGGASGIGDITTSGTNAACVTEVANAVLAPTNLVFMYDKSGSMGGQNLVKNFPYRWEPVGNGLKDFFADPYSTTIRASLHFFPLGDTSIEAACAYPYTNPVVPLAMATDGRFVDAIQNTEPSGGTPTLPALEGAIAYAKGVIADRPNDKTAIVLVTDGQPGFITDPEAGQIVPGCTDNDVAHVASAAQAAREGTPSISTYVIGVGPSLDSLNAIAAAGGTGAAMMVNVNDPAATKSAMIASLDSIRRREVACDFTIPPPPEGQELDINAVNVVLKDPGGTETVVGYSRDCAAAEGWKYDNAAAPTRILLCAAACDTARASSSGNVSIAFGCKTKEIGLN